MAGQPSVFDFAVVIPTEAGAPLTPPYGIVEAGDNLQLRAYFHCGGTDGVVRNDVRTKVTTSGAVQYFLQNLQILIAPIPVAGGAVSELLGALKDAAFRPGGDLFGLGLDPADDYYQSINTANITTGAGNTLQIPGGASTGMWRVLTVLSTAAGNGVSAFDDNLIIQVIP